MREEEIRGKQMSEKYKKSEKENNNQKNTKACIIQAECGGCLGQEETYVQHLAGKQKNLEALLGTLGKIAPIIGMENPYHYRKKIHMQFGHDRNGIPICGTRDQITNRMISLENCSIDDEKACSIIVTIRDLLKSFKIKTFDENSGFGLLRHVMVRNSIYSGEIMVVLVLSSTIMPSKNNFVKALRKIHPEIDTIIINENFKKTKVILGEKEIPIYGKGFIIDSLCGKEFRISTKSLYPVNPVQAEVLYKKALSFAALTGNEIILDAYCGIGTIGILAADQAKKVISVDMNNASIRDAISNVKRNKIKNVDFYSKEAGEFVEQVVESEKQKIDVVFMDPPRAGSEERFLTGLVKLSPQKIVYISRNIVSLVKDLEYLTKKGYKVKEIVGIDMCPWTSHIDCCVLLKLV